MTPPRWFFAFLGLVAAAFALSVYLERQPRPTIEQAVAHAVTAQQETVYVERKVSAVQSRTVYRTLRDTLLRTLTDTQLVKETLRQADTTIVRDSLALAGADSVIAAKNRELALALKPHWAPRFRTTVGAYYDPLTGIPSGGVETAFRVIGGAQIVARVEQRPTLERPQLRLGIAWAF